MAIKNEPRTLRQVSVPAPAFDQGEEQDDFVAGRGNVTPELGGSSEETLKDGASKKSSGISQKLGS